MGDKVRISKAGYDDLPQAADEVMDYYEYEVRQDDGLTGQNVALNGTVTVFGDDYYSNSNTNCRPLNLTDGTIGTFCHSDATDVPIEYGYRIDMGNSHDLTHIKVYPRQLTGTAHAQRLGDYVVSLHADDNGSIGAMNWSATKSGYFSGGLGDADVFEASDGTGTFEGQWIQLITTPTGLAYCPKYTLQVGEVRAFVPEPSTFLLLIGGVLAMLVRRRRC
jgi:hypothetical protein